MPDLGLYIISAAAKTSGPFRWHLPYIVYRFLSLASLLYSAMLVDNLRAGILQYTERILENIQSAMGLFVWQET